MENPQNKYRYERKYLLDIDRYDAFLQKLTEKDFVIHHPPRKVNNIYIDSLSKDSFIENIEGESKRNKYRLRWYGERFGALSSSFEVKMKKDKVNRKKTVKLSKIKLNSLMEVPSLMEEVYRQILPQDGELFVQVCNKYPTLLNGYEREYYITADDQIRLTVDRNMYYYNVSTGQESKEQSLMIVELKYASDVIPDVDFDGLELILSKNSKYVSGIELTSIN